jgi:hypothetical protein
MNTYTVSIQTFGQHPDGKTLRTIKGLSEEKAREEADFLNYVEKLQLHNSTCWSIGITIEPNVFTNPINLEVQ